MSASALVHTRLLEVQGSFLSILCFACSLLLHRRAYTLVRLRYKFLLVASALVYMRLLEAQLSTCSILQHRCVHSLIFVLVTPFLGVVVMLELLSFHRQLAFSLL